MPILIKYSISVYLLLLFPRNHLLWLSLMPCGSPNICNSNDFVRLYELYSSILRCTITLPCCYAFRLSIWPVKCLSGIPEETRNIQKKKKVKMQNPFIMIIIKISSFLKRYTVTYFALACFASNCPTKINQHIYTTNILIGRSVSNIHDLIQSISLSLCSAFTF